MARKPPSLPTVKKLFALSGNQCANPDCQNKLTSNDSVVGEICHIEAAEKDGPRYNSKSTDEYRRSFQNLFLLCPICHTEIDKDKTSYKSSLLQGWKKEHEKRFTKSNFKVSTDLAQKAIEVFMSQSNKNTGSGVQFNNQAKAQIIGSQIGVQNNTIFGNEEPKIKIIGARKVVSDFKAIIDKHKIQANPPDTAVIDYQNELIDRIPRPVYLIETKFLRYRKENGRIKSDVKSYEKINDIELDEGKDLTQALLRDFLAKNDPKKKDVLKKQLLKKGQQQPAIITCDGFLVNGNRRKMSLDELYVEQDQSSSFEKMRVVILPENVLEIDIRKIENRYQLQDEGKSEYQGINRALTIKDNMELGYDIRAQLKDDPQHADKDKKAFESEVKKCYAEFINPLNCAEGYIRFFEKSDIYHSISESAGDREGRWEAFKDYSKFRYGVLEDPKQREKAGILEDEVGKIEDFAFKLIRQKDLMGISKLHMFLRAPNMKKYLADPDTKKLLFEIVDEVDVDIPHEEKFNKDGEKIPESEIDKKWGRRYQEKIVGNLMQAKKILEHHSRRYKPVEILNDVLKLLNHKSLHIKDLEEEYFNEATNLSKKILKKAKEIQIEINRLSNKRKR